MNRKKLEALHAAGLITDAQLTAALATADAFGVISARPEFSLELAAREVTLTTDASGAKTLTGVITAYGELIPSHQMVLQAGSLTTRQPLENTKLMRDHDQTQPVGYMTEVDSAVEIASFAVASSEAERVQQEFDDKLRDGLSIGFQIFDYELDDDWVLTVTSGEIHEVSLCAIPAVNTARVTSVAAALATARKENHTMNRAQLAAALTAGKITQEQHDAALAALDVTELDTRPRQSAPNEVQAGPELQTQQTAPVVVADRPLSLKEMKTKLAAAFNTGTLASVNMALADIIPSDDAGQAWMRDDWIGELWKASEATRPWVDAIGAPQELKSLKGKGWHWVDKPEVEEYAGDKGEVASNEIGTLDDEFTAFRIAAGWDVDRAFIDFADPEFQDAFWAAVTDDYKLKSNTGVRTRVLAAATAGANVVAGGSVATVKALIRDVRATAGAKANRVFLGDDLFSDLEDVPTENLPLWLKSATIGLDIAEGTANIGQLAIMHDPALGAKVGAAFDSRAITLREKSPLQVQALNIPNGGIDLGIFGYMRVEPHDTRVIVKRTWAPA